MKNFVLGVVAVLALPAAANAQIALSTGAGSAVTTVDAIADFESVNALTDNPYLEGGLSFSRTGLTFDNNSCGFAGCVGHVGFTGFSGNYMYGVGSGGFFEIATTGTDIFTGLEFVLGTGFFTSTADISWEAFLSGGSVGLGSGTFDAGTVLGFSGGSFDMLRFSSDGSAGLQAPAFDTVRAQLTADVGVVPEPATWAMMLVGFGFVGAAMRSAKRRQARVNFAF